jgi:hypothetical protein
MKVPLKETRGSFTDERTVTTWKPRAFKPASTALA